MQKLILLGIIAIFIGFLLVLIGSLGMVSGKASNVKSAGVVFIGPFPIGWASDKNMFYVLVGLVVVMIILWIVFKKI